MHAHREEKKRKNKKKTHSLQKNNAMEEEEAKIAHLYFCEESRMRMLCETHADKGIYFYPPRKTEKRHFIRQVSCTHVRLIQQRVQTIFERTWIRLEHLNCVHKTRVLLWKQRFLKTKYACITC